MSTPSIDRAIRNLVTWAARGKWKRLQQEFYATHFDPVADGVEISDHILTLLPGGSAGVVSVFILESFFTALFGEHGELNVVDDYLKRRGWRESVPGRSYLKALRNSTVSLYEVVDIVPGRYVTVQDLILGGDVAKVEEKPGSREAASGDRLAARVVARARREPVHGRRSPRSPRALAAAPEVIRGAGREPGTRDAHRRREATDDGAGEPGDGGHAACCIARTIRCVLGRPSQVTARPDLHHLALFRSHEHAAAGEISAPANSQGGVRVA